MARCRLAWTMSCPSSRGRSRVQFWLLMHATKQAITALLRVAGSDTNAVVFDCAAMLGDGRIARRVRLEAADTTPADVAGCATTAEPSLIARQNADIDRKREACSQCTHSTRRALDPTGDYRSAAQLRRDQVVARPALTAVMIRAIAQPAADSKGTLTMIMATGFGRNFTPSVPRTYAPIGRM